MGLVSKGCIDYVKRIEGFSNTVYLDVAGVPTLGYGMTGNEIIGLTGITEVQASIKLEQLLNDNYAVPIKKDLESKKVTLKQNEFDALVSMAYNIGVGALLKSTLYKDVIKGIRDRDKILADFLMWNKATIDGKLQPVAGLTRRRTEEAEMFLSNGRPSYQERYVKLFQEFYNEATKTNPPLVVDGECGSKTIEAYEVLGRLLKGVY